MEHIRSISPILHLDLNNCNSPEAKDSRYVLTSPRSLESCARLGVKPVDLLFRSLTDVIDENLESSLEEVTVLYEEYERGRRERLRLCREERERIIQEGWNRKSSVKPFRALETVLEQKLRFKTLTPKPKVPVIHGSQMTVFIQSLRSPSQAVLRPRALRSSPTVSVWPTSDVLLRRSAD